MSPRSTLAAAALTITISLLASTDAEAQQRRRSADGEAPPPPSGPVRMRVPYAGTWEGTLSMRDAGMPARLGLVVEVADSASGRLQGTSFTDGSARSPHLETIVRDGRMQWKERAGDRGMLLYSATLVAPDSIAGTVARQAADGTETPAGTFVLTRRRSPVRSEG